MDSKVVNRLQGLFVHTPSDSTARLVERMLMNTGLGWHPDISFGEPCDKHGEQTCIAVTPRGNISLGSLSYYQGEVWYSGVSVTKLSRIIGKGKEPKMKEKLVGIEGLKRTFIHTPNNLICAGVQKMMLDAGLEWCNGDTEVDRTLSFPGTGGYGKNQCLSISESMAIEHCSRSYYAENNFRELSVTELGELLADYPHTMMTEEEMHTRFNKVLGEEGALVLSIEKWNRLFKEENWSVLVGNPETYIQSNTCGLCELHQRTSGGNGCASCSLSVGNSGCSTGSHPWQEARFDVNRGDHTGFLFHAKELIEIMQKALIELRRPKKTYKLGQWFRLVQTRSPWRNHFYLIGSTSPKGVVLIDGNTGERRSESVKVVDVGKITEEEFSRISGTFCRPEDFITVDVDTTVRGKK